MATVRTREGPLPLCVELISITVSTPMGKPAFTKHSLGTKAELVHVRTESVDQITDRGIGYRNSGGFRAEIDSGDRPPSVTLTRQNVE